ncbi:MAG: PAS domain-containing protein [Ferrovibrio sp.]|uniref:PAS domain-containing protein n=1 Tax=Ferrovibrio sp. TaxID=1917215 RepID=UPI00391B985A
MTVSLDDAIAASTHPRLLTTDFLKICSPRIRRFWEYWVAKRGDRPMPSRRDIEPTEIPDLLPYIVLTEVLREPPYLRYRLVGTKQVAVRGHDPTGEPVRGHYIGHHLGQEEDEVLLNYRIVIERHSLVYDYNPTLGPIAETGSFGIKPVRELGTLLLPLSSDGETVDMVFCCADIEVPGDLNPPSAKADL